MRETQPRLGRGLATLLGREDVGTDGSDSLHALPLAAIGPNPNQPRRSFDPESLAELAASIARQGVLQPILVRRCPDAERPYQIIAGERRWRAAAQAGLTEIPCLVRDLPDTGSALAALVENLQRDDLSPLDEAEGFRQALERFGMTQEELARSVGKSRSHVANMVRLLQLPERVREHVRSGRLTAGHARALLAHGDPEWAAERVIAQRLNVRETEALAGAPADTAAPSRSDSGRDPDLVNLERELTARLGLSVTIMDRQGSGRVAIRYSTLDQLDGIITLLKGS